MILVVEITSVSSSFVDIVVRSWTSEVGEKLSAVFGIDSSFCWYESKALETKFTLIISQDSRCDPHTVWEVTYRKSE